VAVEGLGHDLYVAQLFPPKVKYGSLVVAHDGSGV
jgi:hypothetical protein